MSGVPSWIAEAELQRQAELERLRSSVPTLAHKPADSFHTAPGWRELAFDLTCVPNGLSPWNPEVVKAIWKFDPTFVPMWVNWAFAPPGHDDEAIVFGRHVIGRYDQNLTNQPADFTVEMPSFPCQGITFKRPNVLELVLMMPTNTDYPESPDLPGDYVAFDWPLVEWLRERYKASEAFDHKDYINRKQVEHEVAAEKRREEEEYRQRDLMKFVNKQLEKVSEVEIKNHLLGQFKKKQPKKLRLDLGKR